jgi:hypothetical protein
MKKNNLKVLMDLHIVSPPEYKKVGLHVWMCALCTAEWLDRFYGLGI